MSFDEEGGFCTGCGKRVMVRRKGTNHILHLLLSIITFGFWIIVWILASLIKGPWRCSICGSDKIKE